MMMMMKHITALNLLLLSVTANAVPSALRGSATNAADAISLAIPSRQLQDDEIEDFVPLACNANLASVTCSSWSSKFGTADTHSVRRTITCGECVTMDHASGNLSLLGGLDVHGKLVFPDGYSLNLVTTMIAVQGELEMTASKPVDGTPQIKLTMIGNDDQMTFTPIDANANACKGVSTCATGKKAIVVAGGKVNSKYQHVPFLSFAYRPCDEQSKIF